MSTQPTMPSQPTVPPQPTWPPRRPSLADRRVGRRFVQAWVLAAAIATVAYLVVRFTATLQGVSPAVATALLAAELVSATVFGLRAVSAWATPVEAVSVAGVARPDVAVVIDARGRPASELHPTLVALRRVSGATHLMVCADGDPDVRRCADRFGAEVVDVAPLDAAAWRVSTAWVALLESGDLPAPDLFDGVATLCAVPEVAVVQIGFDTEDPAHPGPLPEHVSVREFEHEVVRPSLAAWGSVPWSGDGPSLVRRSALASVIDQPDVVDEWSAGDAMTVAGLWVAHTPEVLARVRRSSGLAETLGARHHRLARAMRAVRRSNGRGLPASVAMARLAVLIPWMSALVRATAVIVAVSVLVLEVEPLTLEPTVLVAAGACYGARWIATLLLGRGRLRPLTITRAELRTMAVDLSTPVRLSDRAAVVRTVFVLGAICVFTAAGMGMGLVAVWSGSSTLPTGLFVAAFAVSCALGALAAEAIAEPLVLHQRRKEIRVRLGLVTCRIESHDGQLVDLSAGGAGVLVPGVAAIELPEVGGVTTLSFRIPDAGHVWRNVSTLVRVANRRTTPDGVVLGLEFDDPLAAPLDMVVEFLMVDHRRIPQGQPVA